MVGPLEAQFTARVAAAGPDLALSVRSERQRALLFVLATASQLLHRVQALEGAVAKALGVPLPDDVLAGEPAAATADAGASKEEPAGEAAAAVSAGGAADKDVEAAEGGGGNAAGTAPAAPPAAQPRQAARRRRLKPYLSTAAMLLALCSSAATWLAIFKGCAAAARALPAALSSRQAFGRGEVADRATQRWPVHPAIA